MPRKPTSDPVAAEYRQLANRYDHRWARYVAASARATLARVGVGDGDRVLDVGCGTGILLAQLAERSGARLAGVDRVDAMLAVARRRLPADIALSVADAEALPFNPGAFDVAISSSVFHYLRQPEMVLAEMARVLAPGGRLILTDWCRDYLTLRALDRYLRRTNRAHFRTYTADELSRLVAAAGFEDVTVDRYRLDPFWGLMTITAYSARGG